MMFKLCPACRYVNDADAARCEDCGAALGPGDPDGPATATAPRAVPRRVEPTPRAVPAPQPVGTARQGGAAMDRPVPEDPQSHAARAEARAARRAAVRLARLQGSAADNGHFVPEVLVLDRDAVARDTLSGLLRLFGFGVIGVADANRAALLLAERPFTAVFADIALDGADGGIGIEFCRRLREAAAPKVLVLVSAPLKGVDRVRAQLLGFDGMLPKPARRGDVARVLDARGVALPCDARRH
jgi:CheY-like chemotaxis protein